MKAYCGVPGTYGAYALSTSTCTGPMFWLYHSCDAEPLEVPLTSPMPPVVAAAVLSAPLGKRVLFVPDAEEEKTAGGILLPSSSSPRGAGYITGEVVAVGEGVDCVKAGTKALVSGYGGAEVDFQGRKAKFVLDSDVIATLST